MLLDQLQPNYALAEQVSPDGPDIETGVIEYESQQGHGAIKGLMLERGFTRHVQPQKRENGQND